MRKFKTNNKSNNSFTYNDYKTYHRLLRRVLKTTNLYEMKNLINSYVEKGLSYPSYTAYSSSTSRSYGDCNGDGTLNILDVVVLINYILNIPIPGTIELTESNCDISIDFSNGSLQQGDGDINILDIVSLVNFILGQTNGGEGCMDTEAINYNPFADIPCDNCCEYDIPPLEQLTDQQLINHVWGYQDGGEGFEDSIPFAETNVLELEGHFNPFEVYEGSPYVDHMEFQNVVLITAPHAQRHYRPTKWDTEGDPSSGLYSCSGWPDSCHKSPDTCTGSMAKVLGELTGATVVVSRYKQTDPNYYDVVGTDWDGYSANMNIGSGNEADPEMGYYSYGGIQTPGLYDEYISMDNNMHPFKDYIAEYLTSNPNIKLVIDLHGASTSKNHWDVDFGLLGNNGSNGTTQIQFADIGGIPPTLDYNFLTQMVDIFTSNEIGLCDANCFSGCCSDCSEYGYCPDSVGDTGGHGPLSFNDFAGANQASVTKFVNENFGAMGVQAVQLETSAIYRCIGEQTEERDANILKYMRALQQIVESANIYYSDRSISPNNMQVRQDFMGRKFNVKRGFGKNSRRLNRTR